MFSSDLLQLLLFAPISCLLQLLMQQDTDITLRESVLLKLQQYISRLERRCSSVYNSAHIPLGWSHDRSVFHISENWEWLTIFDLPLPLRSSAMRWYTLNFERQLGRWVVPLSGILSPIRETKLSIQAMASLVLSVGLRCTWLTIRLCPRRKSVRTL